MNNLKANEGENEMDFFEIKEQMDKLNISIKRIVTSVPNFEWVDYDNKNADESFLYPRYQLLFKDLQDVSNTIEYLNKKITCEGTLYRNKDGRYELKESVYFTTGDTIEIYHYDEFSEKYVWTLDHILHNGDDYYVRSLGRDTSLEGMRARTRE